MSKKYYKVVNKHNMSVFGYDSSITYTLNKFVYPTKLGTFLFIFDTLENAQLYAKNCGCLVYECECEGVQESIPDFMSTKFPDKAAYPKGTLFAYGVKLIKLINEIEPFEYYVVFGKGRFSQGIVWKRYVNKNGDITFSETREAIRGTYNNIDDTVSINGGDTYNFECWTQSTVNDECFYTTKYREKANNIASCIENGLIFNTNKE